MFFGSRFSIALLRNVGDFATEIHFGREKPEHVNAPVVLTIEGDCEKIFMLISLLICRFHHGAGGNDDLLTDSVIE